MRSRPNNKLVWTAMAICAIAGSLGLSKPLYILGDLKQYPGKLLVFDILGPGLLEQRGQYDIPQWQEGSVGIAIDSDGGFLFITYETSNWIQIINGQTIAKAGLCIVDGAENLAGVVYDHHKRLLYCIDRGKDRLFILDWDGRQLRQRTGSPVVLKGVIGFGLALDETNDLLYVANASKQISVYRTSDWTLAKTVTLGHVAISVAVDHRRQLLYTGSGYSFGDRNLVKYDLNTGIEYQVEVDQIAGVIGIAVDDQTGSVYLTTGLDQAYGGDDLMVFSPDLQLLAKIHLGGNPTGLVIPLSEFGLAPLQITKTVIDGAVWSQGVNYVKPGNFVTYEICISNPASNEPVTDLVMKDQFPAELEFFNVEGMVDSEGIYNPQTRTFTYRRSTLYPDTTVCLRLRAQVLESTPPGLTITNTATVSARQTETSAATASLATSFRPLVLSKSIVPDPNQIVTEDAIYVKPGATLTYQITVANPDNETAIPDVMVVDTLPSQVEFVTWQATAGAGVYDPGLHAYTHVISPVQPKASYTINLTTKVRQDIQPGTAITNVAHVDGQWTPPVTAQAAATAAYERLAVAKSILMPQPDQDQIVRVAVGQEVIYHIDVTNLSEAVTSNVLITDVLPSTLELVSVGATGSYDPVSRTCSWLLPALMPGELHTLELVARPNATVQAGQTIENSVTVSSDQTGPASASTWFVVYLPELQAQLELIYSSPVCKGCTALIQAVVTLPSNVKVSDVDLAKPLTMAPGNARASTQMVGGRDGTVKVRAFFDAAPLLNATVGYGPVAVTVNGWLRSGQAFSGQASFMVTRAMR